MPRRMTNAQYDAYLRSLAAQQQTGGPQTIINPYVEQTDLPPVPANLQPEQAGQTESGLGFSVSQEVPLPAGFQLAPSTNVERAAATAASVLQSRQAEAARRDAMKHQMGLLDAVWNRVIDTASDPDHPLSQEALGQVATDFASAAGLRAGQPNPVRLLGLFQDEENPEAKLAKEQERIMNDPLNRGGYESFLRMGEDGEVDYRGYFDRVKLDNERTRIQSSLFKDVFESQAKMIREKHGLGKSSLPPTTPEEIADFRRRSAAAEAEIGSVRDRLLDKFGLSSGQSSGTPGGGPAAATRILDFSGSDGAERFKQAVSTGSLEHGQTIQAGDRTLYFWAYGPDGSPDGKPHTQPPRH